MMLNTSPFTIEETPGKVEPPSLLEQMLAAEVDVANPPPPDDPVFYVADRLTGTTGNVGALVAKAKTGKTAIIGAHVAACLRAEGLGHSDSDTLGIRSEPPKGKAVIVVDTEQSPSDACRLVERALRRVGLSPADKPSWLRTFSVAGWKANDISMGLPDLLQELGRQHGGIHAVFIDGGADLAANVNDPEAAANLCAGWHGLAIKHHCHVLVVIHSNEGEKADDVARGWLGKQLRRKAESNLQLKRNGDTTVLFSETGQRRAPIPENEGPAFTWSEAMMMHVSTQSLGEAQEDRKKEECGALAQAVLKPGEALQNTEVIARISGEKGVQRRRSMQLLAEMVEVGVVTKFGSSYKLSI